MAKFNVVQKRRRAQKAEKRRAIHGDPLTAKLHNKSVPLSISSKRKHKLSKKWRREQKEALEKGLVTMEDVEMAISGEPEEGSSKDGKKTGTKFHMKKGLKLKHLKCNGKSKRKSKPAAGTSADSMVE